jgi:hypothetical protein
MKDLLSAIARTIVEKPTALTGFEVRFLRKRLSKKGTEFAKMVGFVPERLSTVENKGDSVEPGRDRLIRMIYRVLSGDVRLKNVLSVEKKLEQWLASIHGGGPDEKITATWLANRQWKVETIPQAA